MSSPEKMAKRRLKFKCYFVVSVVGCVVMFDKSTRRYAQAAFNSLALSFLRSIWPYVPFFVGFNTQEAAQLLADKMAIYKLMDYAQLQRLLVEQDTYEVFSSSGKEYQIEIQAFCSSADNSQMSIFGSIDDGWMSPSHQVLAGFSMNQTGEVIYEAPS